MNHNAALDEYRRFGLSNRVESATPHRLIQMLMEGALQRIASAKHQLKSGDIPGKGQQISWAISMIDGLRASLDKSGSGDHSIAQNLDDLYDYMIRRLFEANLRDESEYLDEVTGLLEQIKDAWDAIPQEIIQDHAQHQAAQS